MLPVSSCLHWTYRNCHLSSYLLDGGPGAAVDVSSTKKLLLNCYWKSVDSALWYFLVFKVTGLYSKAVCQLQSMCFSRNTYELCKQSRITGFASNVNGRVDLQRICAGGLFLNVDPSHILLDA